MQYRSLSLWMFVVVFILGTCGIPSDTPATTVDFEDVVLPEYGYYCGEDYAGGFNSRGVFFPNSYVDYGGGYFYWDNWACSWMTDTTTGDYTNQFSAITGEGAGESSQYAVSFMSFVTGTSNFSLPYPNVAPGAYITNTTYAYFTMLNGNSFSKKFGGESGTDPDWFKLTITGKNASGAAVGSIDFYLADYRDSDPNNDYIINQWTWVDLSGFGNNVKSLVFGLNSSDTGIYGMNTPGYFAMDTFSTAPDLSWTGSQNCLWNDPGNWSSGYMPGTDQNAVFKTMANTTIDLNGNRNIQNVSFDNPAVGSFTFNNNTLTLDAHGSITVTGTVTTSQTFNCNLALAGNGSLINDSTADSQSLNITGDIYSTATGGGQTLFLGGAGNGLINGTISDGTSGGTLSLAKQGLGTWTLSNTLSYSGETIIEEGLLQISGAANLHEISGDGALSIGDDAHSATVIADSVALHGLYIGPGSKLTIHGISGGQLAGNMDAAAVPEPSVFTLLLIGAAGWLIWKARPTVAAL